jgi:hypothetical protein
VVLNDEINSARDVTKTDALRLHTFQSRTVGVLGVVDADRVVYYRHPLKRRGARVEFDVQAITTLPRVDIVMVYQDAPGDLIKAAVDAGARGLVVANCRRRHERHAGRGPDRARSKQCSSERHAQGWPHRRGGAAVLLAFAQRAATTVSAEDLAPEGSPAADARAHAHHVARRDSADVRGVLRPTGVGTGGVRPGWRRSPRPSRT